MTTAVLILVARITHILAGIAWAGAVFMMTSVVLPIAVKHGAEGAGRWVGMIGRRVGPASGIAALLTILSGIYLMVTLHSNDTSVNVRVLQAGAVAAVLSLIVGFFIGRPAGLKLAQLNEQQAEGGAPSAEVAQQIARLRTRSAVSARLTAALLALAILAMAVFRYVQMLA
jgi:uncharacterized membrane protein